MGDDSGVEFVFLWPLFAVFHQAVLPEEFSGLKSVKLLALQHSGPVRIGPANEPRYVRPPAFANAEAVVAIELAVDDRPRIRIDHWWLNFSEPLTGAPCVKYATGS